MISAATREQLLWSRSRTASCWSAAQTRRIFLLTRFNNNGTLDTTFGTNGKTTTDFLGFSDYLSDLKVLADGRIVAVGSATYTLTLSRFAVAVYNAGGGLTEMVTTIINTGDTASAVEAQADGKLVVAGTTSYDNLARVFMMWQLRAIN